MSAFTFVYLPQIEVHVEQHMVWADVECDLAMR
jgi:hypothetical protein